MITYLNCLKQLNIVFTRVIPPQVLDQVWFDVLLYKLTPMGLNRKLIRWISSFLNQRKLIISINNELSDQITPMHGVPQGSPLSPILFILYVSDIPQLTDAQVNLSQFLTTFLGIRSINLRLRNYLNQFLDWCDRWRIKLNPWKIHLINFSQRNVSSGTLITMYGQPLKVTPSEKFFGVTMDCPLNTKLHVEHIERTCH